MSEAEEKRWYVAYVKAFTEKKLSGELKKIGFDCYLPVQKCRKKWSDRVRIVDKLVLPRIIFIHETPQRRLELLKILPDKMHFLSENGPYSPAVIPDNQMDLFMKMVSGEESEVEINTEPLVPGDRVRVRTGILEGQECELVRIKGRYCITARLGILGAATVEIPLSHLEKIHP